MGCAIINTFFIKFFPVSIWSKVFATHKHTHTQKQTHSHPHPHTHILVVPFFLVLLVFLVVPEFPKKEM